MKKNGEKTQEERVMDILRKEGIIYRNTCLNMMPSITRLGAIIKDFEYANTVVVEDRGYTKNANGKKDYYYKVKKLEPKEVIVYTVQATGQKIIEKVW